MLGVNSRLIDAGTRMGRRGISRSTPIFMGWADFGWDGIESKPAFTKKRYSPFFAKAMRKEARRAVYIVPTTLLPLLLKMRGHQKATLLGGERGWTHKYF